MKILVTGGCGYIGTVLTEELLNEGHYVNVVDTQWFGNYLKPNKKLFLIKKDIRSFKDIDLEGVEAIVHLANIANDPGVELNPNLSWEVNVLATQQIAERAIESGVKQFIYASSGSVYGVKKELNVTEDLNLMPISVYNKTKMVSERILLSYQNEMQIHCIRPATVCGWSPRMRLDLLINDFVYQAIKNKNLTIYEKNFKLFSNSVSYCFLGFSWYIISTYPRFNGLVWLCSLYSSMVDSK